MKVHELLQLKSRPVYTLSSDQTVGMLTLADLIENQINMLTDELHHLRDYIDDLHHAGQD
jgi:hypothetical protein